MAGNIYYWKTNVCDSILKNVEEAKGKNLPDMTANKLSKGLFANKVHQVIQLENLDQI